MVCLSSRVPYGEAVTPEKMAMIEQAENTLRALGFYDVRVRHHELKVLADGTQRSLARIEVGPGEMSKFLTDGAQFRIAEALKKVGYLHVTLDLMGYRRGSANEAILKTTNANSPGAAPNNA
jgi:uncharacterized protein